MGNKKPLDGREVTTFGEELDLFGGRLILRRIGGHTPGLSVVEVPFACGQVSVIAGDACYSPDNIVRKIPTASTGNAAESAAFFARYADPKYRILLGHEPTAPFGGNGIREVIHGVDFVESPRWGGGRRIFVKDSGCRGETCTDAENQKSRILERARQIMAQPGGDEKIYLEASGNVCEAAARAYRERPDLFRALAVSDVPAAWRGVKGGDTWQYVTKGKRKRRNGSRDRRPDRAERHHGNAGRQNALRGRPPRQEMLGVFHRRGRTPRGQAPFLRDGLWNRRNDGRCGRARAE